MRDNMPVILFGLIVVFIITIIFDWGMDYFGMSSSQRDVVGVVEGKKLTYTEFSEQLRQTSENYKKQSGSEPDENTTRQLREQVWTNFVNQTLLDIEIDKMGLSVSDQEIVDWVRGENPPPFLVQQFKDSLGQFNRTAYESAINDPRNRQIWVEVEKVLKQQRLAEKVQSIVGSSVRVSTNEVLKKYNDQSTFYNAEYAFFDPNLFVNDNEVNYSENDLRDLYLENQKDYKKEATRILKFVQLSAQASKNDTNEVLANLENVKKQVDAGIDFKDIQKTYTETEPTYNFFGHGSITPTKEKLVFNSKVGSIVGPFIDVDGAHLIKILRDRKGAETFIKASHILLTGDESKNIALAKELLSRAKKGEDFNDLAKQFSQEPNASTSGGELGWFGKGRMVKPFEEAVFKSKKGEIIGPVKTEFGIHVIKVEGKDNREVELADILIQIQPSANTKDEVYQKAADFSYLAKKGKFEEVAQSIGVKVEESQPFQKGGFIPGLGFQEAISKFAFDKEEGEISEVYFVSDGYAVVMVSKAEKEGIRAFDEVKESLIPKIKEKKKIELSKNIAKNFSKELNNSSDLSILTNKDSRIKVQTTGEFNLAGSIPTIGTDYYFTAAVQNSQINKIPEPVKGTRGYYLIKKLSATSFDTTKYNSQKESLTQQILNEKKQRVLSEWLVKLKENSDIEDNRDLFFR
ncbi:MAG: peptidylprolyl isomerase [Bacteroidetes bacterium]|nr:peptidylprolyl isomerase [Bacteroidota bacterium]